MRIVNALSQIMEPQIGLRKSRRETFCGLICGVLQSRTVNLTHLAAGFANGAQPASNYRRFQRFFEQTRLDMDDIARFLVTLCGLDQGNFHLLIDRTDWDLGATRINILMLAAVHEGIAIPLAWELLDRGACPGATVIALIDRIRRLFPHTPAASLAADREFMSHIMIDWAKDEKIQYVVRLRDNTHIGPEKSGTQYTKTVFEDLPHSADSVLETEQFVFRRKSRRQVKAHIAAKRHRDGTLLVLACTQDARHGLEIYKERWQIETLFAALKSRGFNLTDTHIIAKDRLAKLLAILSIAFVWAMRTGLWRNTKTPIKRKRHGRRAQSFFRYGLDFLRNALAQDATTAMRLIPWHILQIKPG